jgi:hypothetical protein
MALTKFTSCLAAPTIFLNQGCNLLRATSALFLFNLCFHAHKLPISRPKPSRWGSAVAYPRTTWGRALRIYRQLAQKERETYLPYVATTLNNLGILDSGKNRVNEARKEYAEALEMYRELG